jgi:hypothetical protein
MSASPCKSIDTRHAASDVGVSWLVHLLTVLCLLGFATRAQAQSVLYITNGDSASLQAIDVTTGSILYTATTTTISYPIAVRNTIWIGQRDNSGPSIEYQPGTGAPTGNQVTLTGTNFGEFVDGAVFGNLNFTLTAFGSTATVYQTNIDWSNPVALFNVSGNDLVGITFDSVLGTLWISDTNSIYQYSLGGTLLSQFTHVTEAGSLAFQASTNSFWFVPNNAGAPLLQYSPTGALLQSLTTPLRSNNVWGAEFEAIPEPSTVALLGTGLILAVAGSRRRIFR